MEWINKESVLRICEAESEDVAAIISKVKRLPIKCTSEWISVSDRLPDKFGTYIVAAHDGSKMRVTFMKYQSRAKQFDKTGRTAYWRITHWMPLPEAPKEDA